MGAETESDVAGVRACVCVSTAFVPVMRALREVDAQAVRPLQRGDVLQVGGNEYSDDAISAATEDEVLADRQAARR